MRRLLAHRRTGTGSLAVMALLAMMVGQSAATASTASTANTANTGPKPAAGPQRTPVWSPRPTPTPGTHVGNGGAPVTGTMPPVAAGGAARASLGIKPHSSPATKLGPIAPAHGVVRYQAPAANGAAKAGSVDTNGRVTVHAGPVHPGVGRLLTPPPGPNSGRVRPASPSSIYNSTQIDPFSSACGFGVNETTIAQSNANPNLVVAGANTYYNASGTCTDSRAGAYYSSDGGQHWGLVILPGLAFPASGDPGIVFDPVRQLFIYSFVEFDRNNGANGRIGVEVSADGISWSRDATLDSNTATHGTDKPSIAVDQNPVSPHYGRVDVNWTEFTGNNAVYFNGYTDDGGLSWTRGGASINFPAHECGNGTSSAFNANGELMVAWADCSGGVNSMYEELSANGGATWPAPSDTQISTTSPLAGAEDPNPADCLLRNGGTSFRCNSFPSLAGDPNASDAGGTAFFIVWANVDSTTQNAQVANVSQLHGLSTTNDGTAWNGGSFAFEFMAFDNFGDKFFPAAAFAPNGRLNVSYSTREDNASSVNPNGRSFDEHETEAASLTNLRSDVFITYTIDGTLGDPGGSQFIGDYAGTTSQDNNFDTFPIWTDVRHGVNDARAVDLCYANCPTFLLPDAPLSIGHGAGSSFTDFYQYNIDSAHGSGSNFWNVVGIREGADGISVDDDTSLSPNHYYNFVLTSSAGSPPFNDYTMVNGNSGHAPNTVYYPWVYNFSSQGGSYSVEWDAGHLTLSTSVGDSMGSANVARVYDTFLSSGTLYHVGLRPNGGNTSNYSLALHTASVAAEQGRGNAVSDSGNVAPGQPAFVSYNTGGDATQYDGLVVLNNNGGSGGYTLYRDTAVPSGTVSIDGGAATTNSTSATLTLSATNPTSGDPVTDMQISTDGGATFGPFIPYSTTASATLPGGSGTKTVVVRFRNGAGGSATASASIFLNSASPTISGTPPTNVPAAVAYNFTFTLTGSPAPTTTVTSGSLPPGLSLSSGGTISGSPITAGTYAATVTATNGMAPDATENISIVVLPTLTITPNRGPAKTAVTVHGAGYLPGETVKAVKYHGGTVVTITICTNVVVAADGTFTCSGKIPSAATAGTHGAHSITAKGATSKIKPKTSFTLT